MLILRIRQAEVAAGAGRLDEAYDLVARDERFRSNRRGQETVTRLVAAFVKRGREHLAAGRLPQAGTDCEMAAKLAGQDVPDVAQLRNDLRDAHLGLQRGQRDAGLALAAARRYVEDGALSVGRGMLAQIDDSRARRLMGEIDEQRGRFEAALAAARAAVDRRDWPAAVEAIVRGRGIRANDADVVDICENVARALSQQVQDEINAGRLDRAAQTAKLLGVVDSDSLVARDVARALDDCNAAFAAVERARPHEAAELLRRIAVLFPKTSWISAALKHIEAAGSAISELRAGPLSLVGQTFLSASDVGTPTSEVRPLSTPSRGRQECLPHQNQGVLPDRFILQVDGAGAFLVIRSVIAKIGPISSTALPDVPLIADATAPAVSIERVEDDYFLRTQSPVAVNDKPVTGALLGNGDRIGLSPRCRFTFALPHAASTTAVLDLTGARYPRADVRRVILLDRDLIFGPGPASHVRVPGLASPVVLNLRGGLLRASAPATVNGRPLGPQEGLPVGVPLAAGGASFVIGRV